MAGAAGLEPVRNRSFSEEQPRKPAPGRSLQIRQLVTTQQELNRPAWPGVRLRAGVGHSGDKRRSQVELAAHTKRKGSQNALKCPTAASEEREGLLPWEMRPLVIIAFGDVAVGVIAWGVFGYGVLSLSIVGVGVVALSTLAVGLVLAMGGVAVAPVAVGGAALGYYATGALAWGIHAISPSVHDELDFSSMHLLHSCVPGFGICACSDGETGGASKAGGAVSGT